MNEQAWKEQAARIIDPASWAVMDSYLKQMLRKYKGQNIGYDPEAFKHKESIAIAAALWPLVQQAIAAERGEVVALADAVDAWLAECTDGRVSPHTIKLLRSFSSWANQHTAPPTEAQIRADERERCAKVADEHRCKPDSPVHRGTDNTARMIAAAIRSLKETPNA